MEVKDDPIGDTNQHNFAHARVTTTGDARFNSVAGNMSVYENCVFSREPQAEEVGDRTQENTLFQRICKWLGDINFNSIYSESLSEGTEGTGMWFIRTQEFRRWAEVPEICNNHQLWLAGAGKTILSSIVINYLQNLDQQNEIPVIFAYCRYSEKYSATQIFSSLVKQFLQLDQSTSMQYISQYLLSREKEESRPTNKQLLQVLSSIAATYERVFIVLDGLDEAGESDRQQLLDGLNSLPSNMHLLIMSRPLMSFEYLVPDAAFLDIQARNEDIERFVKKRIDEIPTLRAVLRGKDTARDQLCAAIKKKSRGMFLVARLQVEALKECINVKNLMNTLRELPTGVTDLYLHTLDRIESQDPQKALLAKRTFLWVAYALETLKIQQLQEALAVSLDSETFDEDSIVTEELIHDVCCGLISFESTRGARFIHYTTRDFFRDRCSSWFRQPHVILASSCIIYLSSTKFPFVRLVPYADGHWGRHARLASEGKPDLPRHVSEFLTKFPNHSWPSPNGSPYGNGWIIPELIASGHLAAFWGLKSYLSRHVGVSMVTAINQFTFLHVAAIGGYVDTAEVIMQKWPGLSPHDPSSEGKTPFMLASGCGHTSMLEFFLSNSSKDHHLLNSKASCGCTALACAVRQNQSSAVRVLASFPGINVNATACDTGLSPLAWAARTGDVPIVKQLLSNPLLDVNVRNPLTGYTALFEACFQDNIHIAKLLTSRPDLDVNLGPYCGCTPLILSVYCQREAVIPILLHHPDINLHARCQGSGPALAPRDSWPSNWVSELLLTHPRLFVGPSHADMQFCLERAAELGLESTVKDIISKVLAPANLRPAPPVLVEAAKAGQLSIVEMLLEYADVNAVDDVGCTALAGAAMRGHSNIVTLLVSREDTLINKGSYPPLIAASRRGYTSIVRILLDHQNTDVNVQDTDGHVSLAWAVDTEHWDVVDMLLAMPTIDANRGACPALIKACSKGREKLVQELLEREGIDLNVEDAEGWSPIVCAAFLGHESICNILLGRPELKLTGGSVSPFVQAAAGGSEAVVRLLLSQAPRCNPNDVDGGYTSLSMATCRGFSGIVRLLISRPEVDVNQGSPTSLMQACICGHLEIVRLLLSSGVDVNVQDECHKHHPTALWFACYSLDGGPEIVQLLLEHSDIDVNLGLTLTDAAPLDYTNDQSFNSDLYNSRRLSTPLHAACVRHPRAARMLLAAPGIDVTKLNECGETALEVLLDENPSSEGLKVADYLSSHPDALDGIVGHNLLVHVAGLTASKAPEDVVLSIMEKIVLTPGQMADINLPQPDGLTALSAACFTSGSVRVVSYLLSLPAIDPNCGNPPPVALASISGNADILAMLLRHPKTDPNIETERGYTALGEACAQRKRWEAFPTRHCSLQ
ncbi:hypothetical protein EST38_g6375 [Candolleomyces aberdarensis]|uniref:Ankyrin n=1 Tax=Candolleomyces aberdarensis TaxID=2316362 RepID=A0A4Q2DKS6_9AGAR|nr:hypothetical protein EST38_g6375 [Candolleomyces aberdarensis]